jgi:cytochrome c-type biogenesis protein
MQDKSIFYKSIINTLFFIFGFTVVFVLLGAGAGSFSMFFNRYKNLVSLIGGIIIIIFSIQIMGLLNIPFLNFEKKKFIRNKPRGIFGAFIIGITFAAAWTPCIGPILSSILILAATEESALKGVALLTAYSFGLGIPFIFAVAAYGYFLSFSAFMKKNIKTIKLLSGLLLLGLGLLLVMGQFTRMSQFLSIVPDISLIEAENLSFFIAVVAGFVSFVSPCVLPLIPSYLTFITGVSITEIARAEGT